MTRMNRSHESAIIDGGPLGIFGVGVPVVGCCYCLTEILYLYRIFILMFWKIPCL